MDTAAPAPTVADVPDTDVVLRARSTDAVPVARAVTDLASAEGRDLGVVLARVLAADNVATVLRAAFAEPAVRDQLAPVAALDMDQGGRKLHKDNLDHTIQVVARTSVRPGLVARFAALCHDLGKPATRRIHPDGTVTFHGHEERGQQVTRAFLTSLGFSHDFAAAVNTVVVVTGRLGADTVDEWTDAAVRRLAVDAGDHLVDVLDLARADCTSRRPGRRAQVAAAVGRLEARIASVAAADAEAAKRPVLDGTDVMRILDLAPGPDVGAAMAFLRARYMGPDADATEAATALRSWWSARTTRS